MAGKTGDTIRGKTLTGFKLPSSGPNASAINASENVAFHATYSQGDLVGEGIFTATSSVLKSGDVVSGQPVEGISFVPALNDRGAVAVRCLFSSQQSAILTSSALIAKPGDTIGGQILTSVGLPAINNNGTVAFVGSFSTGTGVFTQKALLARSDDLVAGKTPTSFGPPAINDRGTVAFQSWFSGKTATAIVTPTGLLVKTGDTIAGKTLIDLFFGPTLNSSGVVAFVGVFSGGTGVFTQRDLLVRGAIRSAARP
jgi:hypothetical protein